MFWSALISGIISFLSLVFLETVLGLDNVVFVGILSERVSVAQRPKARMLGMVGAILTRSLLLLTLSHFVGMTAPLFVLLNHAVSLKDLILLGGGLFLLYKATHELHNMWENGYSSESASTEKRGTFWGTVGTIMVMDIVFSLDSVITAVAMTNHIPVMIGAIVVAMIFMIFFVNRISDFIYSHPTLKNLALCFLLLIGFTLIVGSFGIEIPKGYIYFAMGFSLLVETINIKMHSRHGVR